MADRSGSKLVNVASASTATGQWFWSVIVPHIHLEIFYILEYTLIGCADDSTLFSVVPSSCVRVTVSESLCCVFCMTSEWGDLWGMKLNATIYDLDNDCLQVTHNASPVTPINFWQNCAEGVWRPWHIGSDLRFKDGFGETSSFRFPNSFSKALRKSRRFFLDRLLLLRWFSGFVLHVLEYCSAVWCLAIDTYL